MERHLFICEPVRTSTDVKRHLYHDNLYKVRNLIQADLEFQSFDPLSSLFCKGRQSFGE